MHQWTLENHFEFGRLPDNSDTFVVKCGALQKEVLSPLEESIFSATHIKNVNPNEKIVLCLSGGIDSECMAISFLKAKVSFEVVFLRFKDSLNYFDIRSNIDFCINNSIKYTFLDLDILHFLESGQFLEISKQYGCQSPQLAAHLWMLDQIDGLPILAGNPIAPIWKNDHWFYIGLPGELHSVYFKYFMINDRPGIPWFFLYSPEQIASFFNLNCIHDFITKKKKSEIDYTYGYKYKSYQEGGFEVIPRENKFTGFELIQKYYDQLAKTENNYEFNRLFRKPLEEMFPFPDVYLQLIPENYFPKK
ncbi:MAG: hypothetical protein WA160_06125 [Pseudobdellovibrio sp.]